MTCARDSLKWSETVNSLEQYSWRNSVRISGYPEPYAENTEDRVVKIAKELDVDISKDNIDRSHRVGKPTQQGRSAPDRVRPRDILVKFSTYNTRQQLYGMPRNYAIAMTTPWKTCSLMRTWQKNVPNYFMTRDPSYVLKICLQRTHKTAEYLWETTEITVFIQVTKISVNLEIARQQGKS